MYPLYWLSSKGGTYHCISASFVFKVMVNEFYPMHLLDSLLILLVISIRHNLYFHI